MFFTFIEILEVPLLISFSDEIKIPYSIEIFNQIITFFFVLEIIINFNTGYYQMGIFML